MNVFLKLCSLPRAVRVLFVATLINRSGTMVLPYLALYIADELGSGAEDGGDRARRLRCGRHRGPDGGRDAGGWLGSVARHASLARRLGRPLSFRIRSRAARRRSSP